MMFEETTNTRSPTHHVLQAGESGRHCDRPGLSSLDEGPRFADCAVQSSLQVLNQNIFFNLVNLIKKLLTLIFCIIFRWPWEYCSITSFTS